ncbi:uncharacterized protein YdhG (YjbR/CyaY superfamily) [Weissella uvarum]|uniref:hypothetical protein n=1 Tax=Weissella uvarum TaxID=1479233 RepID=UPI001960D0CC|nr:hypothetical protein [Weissella uvarum]MBM7617183.1 uncharacterized protein YdhG (YjbR/CyaY superfamily) [Weissella uvarum]MCM0595479.1 hypothetical protein [Weissella uvarum]
MVEASGFSDFEKQAMKDRALELRREQENKRSKKNPEADVLEAIAEMPSESAYLAAKIHALVYQIVPEVKCKTWYGMPAYLNSDGKVVVFFQDGVKYQSRYCTLGFQDAAQLDDGAFWPTGYALTDWNDAIEQQITQLIKKAFAVK